MRSKIIAVTLTYFLVPAITLAQSAPRTARAITNDVSIDTDSMFDVGISLFNNAYADLAVIFGAIAVAGTILNIFVGGIKRVSR